MSDYKIHLGDCLDVMKDIQDGSIDFVLADPPYGTTACKWDSVIPFADMWFELKRIVKPNKAIVIFGQEPFSTFLRSSNLDWYKYDWYWRKTRPSGFVNARLKPLKDIEIISVFSSGCTANGSSKNMPYYPQNLNDVSIEWSRPKHYFGNDSAINSTRASHKLSMTIEKSGYPRRVLDYSNPNNNTYHPTQKPVDLLEYLIKTYTNEGDTVLDFTMGSGSTGVACANTNRNFIGIELEEKYFQIAKERIENTEKEIKRPELQQIMRKSELSDFLIY